MKKIMLPAVVLVVMAFSLVDTTLTNAERKFAIDELNKTHDRFTSTLDGLSKEQLNYKVVADSWSIAECAEHLAISENSIFDMLMQSLNTEADPSRRDEVKLPDEQIIAMIVDRSNKVKTSKAFEPSGKYGSFEETVEEFKSKRKEHIEYVKTTQDDLRNRYQQFPFGTIDSYQMVLFMSAHTERHIRQMEEIKEDPGFPKS
ncbi:DinB family protein [Arenibacter aquaticus]|uniref:DinB family protein n=1 Tax=Arenibacter aquaticus TaxID=2489054 RepID=A0A3S0AK81_9FLAO|nr:DinB family protein [Arenibacter aquaticus]RTE52085.1 DinB family protein [Arenibacter aquaticus]